MFTMPNTFRDLIQLFARPSFFLIIFREVIFWDSRMSSSDNSASDISPPLADLVEACAHEESLARPARLARLQGSP